MATRERGVRTASVVGAKGGIRQKHVDKTAGFESVARKEDLTASAQKLTMTAGAKASKPSAVSRAADHDHAEGTLAEEETGARVCGVPHTRKAADTSTFERNPGRNEDDQFSLENSRDAINSTPFTSKNFVAPQASDVPSLSGVAPTASLSLSKKEASLKQ
ncbi:unnamed protein product [Ectocarpus fasciculatus]